MMKTDPEIPHRHSIRLKGYDYSGEGWYFVTVVTFRRECLFGEMADGRMNVSALGRIVQECWEAIPAHFPNVTLDAFVFMPNHVHGIVVIRDEAAEAVPVGARHASPLQVPGQALTAKPGRARSPFYKTFATFLSSRLRIFMVKLNKNLLKAANIWTDSPPSSKILCLW
jgi:hypothetical protein